MRYDETTLSENWGRNKFKPTPDFVSSFAGKLIEMEPRFRLFDIFDEIAPDGEHAYIPTKKWLYIPVWLPAADHEIAHFVETSFGKKLVKIDWGMEGLGAWRRKVNSGKHKHMIFQAVAKETRVRAIQSVIGGSTFLLDNSIWISMIEKNLPFGQFLNVREVIEWARYLHNSTQSAWTQERVRVEWRQRLDYVREWMETA
jgi:hypothetical protein